MELHLSHKKSGNSLDAFATGGDFHTRGRSCVLCMLLLMMVVFAVFPNKSDTSGNKSIDFSYNSQSIKVYF